MKTVEMDRDYDFMHEGNVGAAPNTSYVKGVKYERVPEAQATAIVAAGAGRIVGEQADEAENAGTEGKARGRR